MVFEIRFACKGFEDQLAFLLQRLLSDVKTRIFKDTDLVLWIECSTLSTEEIDRLCQRLSVQLPQSLFIGEITSSLRHNQEFPEQENFFPPLKSFAYCPSCLESLDMTECKLCSREILPIDTSKFSSLYSALQKGETIALQSSSGEHHLSLNPSKRIYCLDVSSILEVSNLSAKELQAIASYEKPTLRVRSNPEFAKAAQLPLEIQISIAQDLELLRFFSFLQERGIKFLFASEQPPSLSLFLAPFVAEPLEVLILENDRVLVLKDKMPKPNLKQKFAEHRGADKAFLSVILEEHKLHDQNILHFHFSKEGGDKICLYNAQTQWFNAVMDFPLPRDSQELLEQIAQDGESGEKLIRNYRKAFPTLCDQKTSFASFPQGIYGMWEIARVILGLEDNPLHIASQNLSHRGVAIEYSFQQDSLITQQFKLIRSIRSGMSFKLAGVEEGIIALGYIESFSLLPSKLYLELRDSVSIEGMSLSGDLFASKMLGDFFYKNSRQVPIYRNIEFPLLSS